MARPTKCDAATTKAIVEAVREGLPWELVAHAGGVSSATLRAWVARGRKGEKPYAELLRRAGKAEADLVAELLAVIRRAAEKSPEAAVWLAAWEAMKEAIGYGAGEA